MNRIIIVTLIALSIFAISCKEKEKKQIELLTKENEALRSDSKSKDSTINEFFQILNEIEANLALIKEKENVIAKGTARGTELKEDTRNQINDDIRVINELMLKNKKSIRLLNQKLQDSNIKIAELEKMLTKTNQMLMTRDSEIVVLKERLADLNFSIQTLNLTVDTLRLEKDQLNKTVSKQTEAINTAYYAFGTKKELETNKVVDKTGGFLGLGKTTKLKSDFDQSYFTRIDITKTLSIPLFAKKAKIVTTHPNESYTLVKNPEGVIEKIEITDYEKFWSASKYLVIIIE